MLIFQGFFSGDVCDISEYRVDFAVALTASAVAGLTPFPFRRSASRPFHFDRENARLRSILYGLSKLIRRKPIELHDADG